MWSSAPPSAIAGPVVGALGAPLSETSGIRETDVNSRNMQTMLAAADRSIDMPAAMQTKQHQPCTTRPHMRCGRLGRRRRFELVDAGRRSLPRAMRRPPDDVIRVVRRELGGAAAPRASRTPDAAAGRRWQPTVRPLHVADSGDSRQEGDRGGCGVSA